MAVIQNPSSSALLTAGQQGFEPVLKSRFTLTISRPPQGVTFDSNLNVAVRTVACEGKEVSTRDFKLLNSEFKYPVSKQTSDANFDLILLGGKANAAYSAFWQWFQLVHNDTTDQVGTLVLGGTSGGIGGDAILTYCNPDGSTAATANLNSIYPVKFGVSDLDRGSDADPVNVTIRFVVTEWIWNG